MTGFLDSHKVVAKRDAFLALPSAQNESNLKKKKKKNHENNNNPSSVARVVGPSVNRTLMIELDRENIILNFKLISSDKNYSNFNIFHTPQGLKFSKFKLY
jgi:hypothetical protein